jgi:DNA-directed RNA polymerase specialized sigma subunit
MIRFDSEINNPYTDAINIITKYRQFVNPVNYDVEKFKKQMITVLNERIINNKTLKETGQMLNVGQERVRQIEAKLIRILQNKMKGIYDRHKRELL